MEVGKASVTMFGVDNYALPCGEEGKGVALIAKNDVQV